MIEDFSENKIQNIIREEGLEVCVISYGGCGSNRLTQKLMHNNYKAKTTIWDKILCHCPEIIRFDIPIIYIYRNPIHALLSMKRRGHGIWDKNQKKMSNNSEIELSDENLLQLMIRHFNMWTTCDFNCILIIKYEELFRDTIIHKLSGFLDNPNLLHFPVDYIEPNITDDYISENIDESTKQLFVKYEKEINEINNYIPLDICKYHKEGL